MSNARAEDAVVGVQSVDRALTILSVLARTGQAGVSEIAAELGVHKSTAFRLVSTLENHDIVEQTEDRGKYRLGLGLVRLAGASSARLDLVQEARPVCRRLAADCGETVNIAVLSEQAALYVDQVSGGSALGSHYWVGQSIPLHATSNGKVLLSDLEPEEVDRRVTELPAYTEHTITRRDVLHRQLLVVRDQGYAVAAEELEVGLTALAAPVRSAHGDVVASVSLSGPTFRLSEDRVTDLVPVLVAAGAEVSRRLGWDS
ncbi:MAG: Transcriptional regulator, IclR family [uncultured Nocardioidaceae bacterium]|uniref:Glycerol operon regulatory protein n=1 Tax=uncultured Nocardioidaceae bacterium TaxID=253824 RepID=A0A6J4MP27_9ACTN|nr:MAG: Transcriptional regulator, IclR family [uncultured Nocardioidaceae bacterium]